MGQFDSMDALAKKYEGTVDFVFIYCDDRHAFATPAETPEERVQRARSFRELTSARKLVLIDGFGDQGVKRLYAAHGDSAFIIDQHGRVAAKMGTAKPPVLEKLLQELLSPKYDEGR